VAALRSFTGAGTRPEGITNSLSIMDIYKIERTVGTSAANTAQTVSTATGARKRVISVHVAYSAAPTQAGVTVTLNSGAGAGYDTLLTTGTANAQYTSYFPQDLYILTDDVIDVAAPAGGVGITSSISIYTQIVE